MINFTEIKYNEDYIWAKAYDPKTERHFNVKIFIKKWECKISPSDYDSDIVKAAGNLLLALKKDKFLPEEYKCSSDDNYGDFYEWLFA